MRIKVYGADWCPDCIRLKNFLYFKKVEFEYIIINDNDDAIVFLEGVKAALCADPIWNNGDYSTQPTEGLKAFGRVYAGWAFSQSFFREKTYKQLGFKNVEELLIDWENDHVSNWDANNLLTKLLTWQKNDISTGPIYNNNFTEALKRIEAKAILMPCSHDLYFPPEDNPNSLSG